MTVKPEEGGVVFPNPFAQEPKVKLNIEKEQEVAFTLMDGAGCVIMQDNRYLYEGLQVAQIDVSMLDLPTGLYYLKVETADGRKRSVKPVRE